MHLRFRTYAAQNVLRIQSRHIMLRRLNWGGIAAHAQTQVPRFLDDE